MQNRYPAYFIGGRWDLTKRVIENPTDYIRLPIITSTQCVYVNRLEDIKPELETFTVETYRLVSIVSIPGQPEVLVYALDERRF